MIIELDSIHHNALRRVALGHIVTDDHGRLRHHDDVLPAAVLAALTTLHRHQLITLVPNPAQPTRAAAALTLTGTQLLDWTNRQRASISEAAGRGQSS